MKNSTHPWHPIFVHFPIACWILAFVVELLHFALSATPAPAGLHPGALALLLIWTGNGTAVVAMIAGVVDMAGLPEKPDVMRTVYKHMAWMATAWGFMLCAGILRTADGSWTNPPSWLGLVVEFAAIGCLIVGGLQAAHLVYNQHLGQCDVKPQ